MSPKDDPFDFFRDLDDAQQQVFLEEYLTKTTRYLTRIEFPNSPQCFYFLPEFIDKDHHQNSSYNLAALLLYSVEKFFICPFRFANHTQIHPMTGTPLIYYYFSSLRLNNLSEQDFNAIELVQDDELENYAKILQN